METDATVTVSPAVKKSRVTRKPTGAKAKPTLTKQPSKEKKTAKAPEADEVPSVESDESVASSTSAKKKVAKNPKAKPVLTKQPSKEGNAAESKKATGSYLDMVQEAIEAVGVPRKGASAQAIKKYIHDKKEDNNDAKTDAFIKKALVKGVEKGIFKNMSKTRKGATGSFALVKPPKTKKIPKTQARDSDEEGGHVSDSETFIKPKRVGLLRKRNLSDSAINTMMSSTPKSTKLKVIKSPRKLVKAIVKPKKVMKEVERQESSDTEAMVKPKAGRTMKSSSSDTELNLFSKAKKTKVDDTKKQRLADTRTKKGEKSELPPPKPRNKKLHNPDAKEETQKPAAFKSGKAKIKKV